MKKPPQISNTTPHYYRCSRRLPRINTRLQQEGAASALFSLQPLFWEQRAMIQFAAPALLLLLISQPNHNFLHLKLCIIITAPHL